MSDHAKTKKVESLKDSLSGLTHQVREWVPELRERQSDVDKSRRIPDEYVQVLKDTGILGLATPVELGGLGIGPDGILEIAIELGRGSGATAWCGGNWAIHNMLGAMFSEKAQQELFGGSELPIISTGFSPLRAKTMKVDGGALVSGTWDFASGVDNAEWVVVMAVGDAGPLAHLLPVSDVSILDTWHTMGLQATGSHDILANEAFVPEHRLLNVIDIVEGQSIGRDLYSSPFFKVPLGSFFGCGVIGSIIGMAIGALDVFTDRTVEKVGGITGMKVSSRPEVPLRMGEAAANIDAAVLVARSSYADMRLAAVSSREITMSDRVRWRRDLAWCGKICAQTVSNLYDMGGAHALFDGDPLQQFYRDINAASHHYSLAADTLFAGWGRVLLGLDPQLVMV